MAGVRMRADGAVIAGLNRLSLAADGPEVGLGAPRGAALVVFTDGTDQAGYESQKAVVEALAASRAYVFAIGLDGEVDWDELETIGRDGVAIIEDIGQIGGALDEVWALLQAAGDGLYLVSYCTPAHAGEHEISVSLVGMNATVTTTFWGTEDAMCNTSAASKSCKGRVCGLSEAGYYCGDCAGDEVCADDGQKCVLVCTAQSCGPHGAQGGWATLNCGGCPDGLGCGGMPEGTCLDLCMNWDSHFSTSEETFYTCGPSPNDPAWSCGFCEKGTCVTGLGRHETGSGPMCHETIPEMSVCGGDEGDKPVIWQDGTVGACPASHPNPCSKGGHCCCKDWCCAGGTCVCFSGSA